MRSVGAGAGADRGGRAPAVAGTVVTALAVSTGAAAGGAPARAAQAAVAVVLLAAALEMGRVARATSGRVRKAVRWLLASVVLTLVAEAAALPLDRDDTLDVVVEHGLHVPACAAGAGGLLVLLRGTPVARVTRVRVAADVALLVVATSTCLAVLGRSPVRVTEVETAVLVAAYLWVPLQAAVLALLLGLLGTVRVWRRAALVPTAGWVAALLAYAGVNAVVVTRGGRIGETPAVGLVVLAAALAVLAVRRLSGVEPVRRPASPRVGQVPTVVAVASVLTSVALWTQSPPSPRELGLLAGVGAVALVRFGLVGQEVHHLHQELFAEARRDPLTGLANRLAVREHLQRRTARAVAVLDLDGFKQLNDTSGHAAGDALLRQVADRLRAGVPDGTQVARLGGDEFALLLPERRDAEQAVQAVVTGLARPFDVLGEQALVSASAGVALAEDAVDAVLLERADVAMYASKHDGRGRATLWTPELAARVHAEVGLARDLRAELHAGGPHLRVGLEPVVRLADGAVVAVTALLVWDHPRRGTLPARQVAEVAAEEDLARDLDALALERSLVAGTACHAAGLQGLRLGVDVSADRPARDLARQVAEALRRHDFPAGGLVLELGEALVHDEGAAEVLLALRRLGVALVADDFGAGYGSMRSLAQLPVSSVKLDAALVAGVDEDHRHRVVVEGVVEVARRLGMGVVAAGVDTVAQREALRRLGCPMAQGRAVAPPGDADDVVRLARQVGAARSLDEALDPLADPRARPALPVQAAPSPSTRASAAS